jgi:hypothetical protein
MFIVLLVVRKFEPDAPATYTVSAYIPTYNTMRTGSIPILLKIEATFGRPGRSAGPSVIVDIGSPFLR